MRISILLSFLFVFGCSMSQNLLVIDKSEKTAILFDETNPKSFVSLLQWNAPYLGYFDKTGIATNDLQTLSTEQRAALIPFVGPVSELPLVDEDPNSPDFGEYLLYADPETGDVSFVYDADTMYVDFEGISRIVLEYRDGKQPLLERVVSVTFCKIYTTEYVPVLKVEGNSILSLHGFQFFDQIAPEVHDQHILSTPKGYWDQLRDSSYSQNKFDVTPTVDYFSGSYLVPLWYGYSAQPLEVETYDGVKELSFGRFEELPEYPFDFLYGDSLVFLENSLDLILASFDSVHYFVEEFDTPILDDDPDSPNFGDYMTYLDSNGVLSLVFPEPETYIEWVEFEPYRSYSVSTFKNTGHGLETVVDKMLFSNQDQFGEHLIAIHSLSPYWQEAFPASTLSDFDWKSWYLNYEKCLLKGKKYDAFNKRKRAKLTMSDSFWEPFDQTDIILK